MMLNSDMCLAYDNNLEHAACIASGSTQRQCRSLQNKGVFLNASNTECCAWTKPNALFNNGVLKNNAGNDYCGANITSRRGDFRDTCCSGEQSTSTGDCDSAGWPKGPAFNAVLKYAASEKAWLKDFARAWWISTNKVGGVRRLVDAPMKRRNNKKSRGSFKKGKKGGKGKNNKNQKKSKKNMSKKNSSKNRNSKSGSKSRGKNSTGGKSKQSGNKSKKSNMKNKSNKRQRGKGGK